ncbi:cyanophycinase [bacterium]|nr:cyanophycinase [candidate division CSSED10-310 bacterium]
MANFMLLGGISDNRFPMDLMHAFVETAGGSSHSKIFIVPAATEDPDRLVAKYDDAFQAAGCKNTCSRAFDERASVDSAENLDMLLSATAVFFTGGDQLRLLELLEGTHFVATLHQRMENGLPVGGSSAGAMALGHPLIVRGQPEDYMIPDAIRVEPGLGLLNGIVIDTHMTERSRLGRLINAVSRYPGSIGIGMDENTGILLDTDGIFQVFGPGSVAVLDAGDWNGYSGLQADPEAPREPDSRLTVENVRFNIYKSGDRRISLRMPVTIDNR